MFSQFSGVSLQLCWCGVVAAVWCQFVRLHAVVCCFFVFWSDLHFVACVFVVSDGVLRREYYFRVVVLICLFLAEKDVGLICFSQGGANQCGVEHVCFVVVCVL